jgi:hypothetical protein
MKKQYCPIIVRRDGSQQYAKPFSNYSKHLGDKFFWNLDEARNAIEQAKTRINKPGKHTMVCGGFGIETEHDDKLDVVDSYIKVREVSEWEIIK